jgi:hypothetical protein
MNRKQLIIVLIVGLLLGGLAFYFSRSRQAEYRSRDAAIGQKLLGDFPANDVAQVSIRSHEGEVNLAKDGVWVVRERSNYPASFTKVAELVRKLWDLKPVQSQQIGASQRGRVNLVPPGTQDAGTNTATIVELKDKDGKLIRSVLLGKQQMRDSGGQFGGFPVGRWIGLPENSETVFVVNETFSDVEPDPESWIDKDFFKVEKLKAISLISTNATNSWSLARTSETAPWELADRNENEQLDSSKVSSFNWAFSSPSFNDVYPRGADAVKDAFANPNVLELETFSGFEYKVQVGSQPDPDSFYLTVNTSAELPGERTAPADEKPEDKEQNDKAWKEEQDKLREKLKHEKALGDWVYKVSKWTVDSVLKERHDLLSTNQVTVATSSTNAPSLDLPPPGFPPLPGTVDVQPPLAPEE